MMRQLAAMAVIGLSAGLAWAGQWANQPNGPDGQLILLPQVGMMLAQMGPDTGPQVVDDAPEPGGSGEQLDPNSPAAQQVEAALGTVNEDQPATRDAAEEKLAAYGPRAVLALKDAVGKYAGFKRAAAEGALFRITNGINPHETINAWIKKYAEGLRARQERITDALLGETFPHHLFYVLTFGEKAKLPAVAGLKTRTVVVVAADGKVQTITDDAGLAKFLAVEGGVLASEGDRARIAEAAVLLACGREAGGYPALDEITTSEDKGVVTSVGANRKATVTVAVTVSGGRVATVSVTRGPAPTPPAKKAGMADAGEGESGESGDGPATTAPATAPAEHGASHPPMPMPAGAEIRD